MIKNREKIPIALCGGVFLPRSLTHPPQERVTPEEGGGKKREKTREAIRCRSAKKSCSPSHECVVICRTSIPIFLCLDNKIAQIAQREGPSNSEALDRPGICRHKEGTHTIARVDWTKRAKYDNELVESVCKASGDGTPSSLFPCAFLF